MQTPTPSTVDRGSSAVLARAEVAALLDRYLLGLDDGPLNEAWGRALFTSDAEVEFPVGRHAGRSGLVDFHRAAMAKFARTQHLNSPAVVDLDGDRARLRANLISTQVLPSGALFTTGTAAHGSARRTAGGWRLDWLSFRLIWKTGDPPPAAAG